MYIILYIAKTLSLIPGHSLGSHMSGFIGKYIYKYSGKKVGRITALDPAGPAFENPAMGPDLRLCENDADFVDIVHTDIQLYGYTAPIGHVDFYPNGGKHQIGCPLRENANTEEGKTTLFLLIFTRIAPNFILNCIPL